MLDTILQLLNSLWLLLSDYIFHDLPYILNSIPIWTVGTLLLHMQNEAWHCLAVITMDFPGKDVILMAAYVSVQSLYACTNGTFSHMQVIHAVDANVLGLI